MRRRLLILLNPLISFLCILFIWQILIWAFRIPSYMLPTPLAVGRAMGVRHQALMDSLLITGGAAAGGLIGSTLVGVLAALTFAQFRWVRRMFYPYTILLQTVPIVAIAPLIIMWIGAGILSVMLITFIICLAPIIANTTQGMVSVDENLVHLFMMHNASPARILWKLRLPNALPNLFVGIRISSGISVIGAIIAELFAGSSRVGQGGLGYSIQYANAQMETDYLFALVGAATLLGFSFFFAAAFVEWYFLHEWHESARGVDVD